MTDAPRVLCAGITNLVALTELRISGNNLSVLKDVDYLSPLGNLVCLNMTANQFCDLPHYTRCALLPQSLHALLSPSASSSRAPYP